MAQERVPSEVGEPPGPVRTCIGCRQRVASRSLLRVVERDGHLEPDPAHLLKGRGAHIHPDVRCAETATKRRAWGRALRVASAPDPQAVMAFLIENSPTNVRETS